MKKLLVIAIFILPVLGYSQNTDIQPHLVSFPVHTTTSMNAIPASPDLRRGSTVYNIDLKTLAFFDGCQWQQVKKKPANIPVITNLSMGTAMPPSPEVQLDWTHPNPPAVSQYKVQLSLNHGAWSTVATLPAPATSYTKYATIHFNTGLYHTYRVVAVDTCGGEIASCPQTTLFGFATSDLSRRFLLYSPANFTVGSALQFKVITGFGWPNTFSGGQYTLRQNMGGSYVTVHIGIIPAAAAIPYYFNLPLDLLELGGDYSVIVSDVNGNSNTSFFTYAPPKTCEDDC